MHGQAVKKLFKKYFAQSTELATFAIPILNTYMEITFFTDCFVWEMKQSLAGKNGNPAHKALDEMLFMNAAIEGAFSMGQLLQIVGIRKHISKLAAQLVAANLPQN